MQTFRQGDVVRVPFPYTDTNTRQRRPALVVSEGSVGEGGKLLWVVMITSASNPRWQGDYNLGAASADAGLPIASLIRATKIATIESSHAEALGRIDKATLSAVISIVGGILGR